MDADQPLKMLLRLRPRELLALTGDGGARVLSSRAVELPAVRRTVDMVLKLQRGRDVYLRHLEFQTVAQRGLALRLFDYATRLVVQYRLPVLTTVMLLKPPAPTSLALRECIRGRVVHERRFEVIRLWELDPREMLRRGPGAASLVGLLRASDLSTIGRATRRILRSAPESQRSDLLAILQALSGGRYTANELARVIPREVVMASSLFAEARRMGRAEGELAAARRLCADIVRRRHRAVAARIRREIDLCTDPLVLQQWIVAATELADDELVALVIRRASRRRPVARKTSPMTARKRAARSERRRDR